MYVYVLYCIDCINIYSHLQSVEDAMKFFQAKVLEAEEELANIHAQNRWLQKLLDAPMPQNAPPQVRYLAGFDPRGRGRDDNDDDDDSGDGSQPNVESHDEEDTFFDSIFGDNDSACIRICIHNK